MNKRELIKHIATQRNLPQWQAELMLESVIDGIRTGLKNDGKVQLIGFGTFEVKERGARKGRNPQTGEEITIPSVKTATFSAGADLKKVVNDYNIISDIVLKHNLNDKEKKVFEYVFEFFRPESAKQDVIGTLELSDVSKGLNLALEEVEQIVQELIERKVLTTFDYTGLYTVSLPKRFYKFY